MSACYIIPNSSETTRHHTATPREEINVAVQLNMATYTAQSISHGLPNKHSRGDLGVLELTRRFHQADLQPPADIEKNASKILAKKTRSNPSRN